MLLPAKCSEIIEKARRLTPGERRFAAGAWLGAPLAEAAVRALGLRRTLALVDALPQGVTSTATSPGRAEALVRAAFGFHPLLPGTCLPRAVLQYSLHRLDGAGARLVIGVRRGAEIEAHAWVEPTACAPARPDGYESILTREVHQ